MNLRFGSLSLPAWRGLSVLTTFIALLGGGTTAMAASAAAGADSTAGLVASAQTRSGSPFLMTQSMSGALSGLNLTVTITVDPADTGKTGNLYVAALLPNGVLYALGSAGWQPYLGAEFPAYRIGVTLGQHALPIFDGSLDLSSLTGTKILVGYGSDQMDLLNNQKYMLADTLSDLHLMPRFIISYSLTGGSFNLGTMTGVPPNVTFWAELCWGSDLNNCPSVGHEVVVTGEDQLDDPDLLNSIFRNIGDAESGISSVLSDLYKAGQYPSADQIKSVFGAAVDAGVAAESVDTAISVARSGFAAAGYTAPGSSTSGSGTSGSSTSGSSTSGAGTGSCNLANYVGPSDDPQTATLCQAAYAYSCAGDADATTKTCYLLNAFLQAISSETAAGYCSHYCH
jgi:hypothetical protein